MLRVFVSSTSEDLKAHRAVARHVILSMRWHPVMMEDFGASPDATVDACCQELQSCQLVLLIVAYRRGWVPAEQQGGNGIDSITALELAHAHSRQIPVLVMMANDDWPGRLWEADDGARRYMASFRDSLNQSAQFFGPEDTHGDEEKRLPSFRELVRRVLLAHKERLIEQQQGQSPPLQDTDYSAARDSVLDASCIPVIGHGVYEEGPLSTRALLDALGDRGDDPAASLATVAEYRERMRLTRDRFLDELLKVVTEQSHAAALPPAFGMLLDLPALPPMVVATTYDQMLEDALARQGAHRLVVVTHILRSADALHDGKIAVLRRGQVPITTQADDVKVDPDELVIYRPLGSPLLHAAFDPMLEIDTVVITETDHLMFLGRLENQYMKVPTCFGQWLRKRPLLFLGYGLDRWQYRLFMHVFHAIGGRKPNVPTLAVRRPKSDMERVAWDRLGVRLVALEANEFARRVMPAPAGAPEAA